MNDEGSVHDLVGAYVLDAVDDRERAAFEAHLAGCADCRREVAELSAPVADLSAGLEETPPEGLRSRLLEQIAKEPQAVQEPRAGRRRTWWVGIAAAAAVGVGAVVVTQWGTGEPEPAVVAVQDVLDAPDAQRSTETVDGVTVSVVTSASLNRSAFVAEGMEPAPDGQDYQLWFVHEDGTAVSAGLMPRGEQDTSEVVLEGEAAGAVAVGVTLEPAGGSDQPTSDPLVAVPLSG